MPLPLAKQDQEVAASRSQPVLAPSGHTSAEPSAAFRYRCCECLTPTHIADLNDDMLCAECGDPELDPNDCAPSADELFRTECTWSV